MSKLNVESNRIKKAELDFIRKIGKTIRKYRRKRGYTLDYLSPKINVSTATLSRYENGKIDITASTMARISEVCDFSIEEYTREPYPESPSEMFRRISGEEDRKIRRTAREKKEDKSFDIYIERSEPARHDVLLLTYQLHLLALKDKSPELKKAIESLRQYIVADRDKEYASKVDFKVTESRKSP